MSSTNAVQNSAPVRIGDTPHSKRNLMVVAGIVVGGGLMGLLYWHWGKTDNLAIQELQQFREQMATQCKQEQFAKPAPKELNSLYADSSRMQSVVHAQLGRLERGQADCEQILKTIKSVDFPVE
jgi:hypothetical protein